PATYRDGPVPSSKTAVAEIVPVIAEPRSCQPWDESAATPRAFSPPTPPNTPPIVSTPPEESMHPTRGEDTAPTTPVPSPTQPGGLQRATNAALGSAVFEKDPPA